MRVKPKSKPSLTGGREQCKRLIVLGKPKAGDWGDIGKCMPFSIGATIGTDFREVMVVLPGLFIGSKCGLFIQISLLGDIGQCPHFPMSIPNGWHNFSSDFILHHKHINIPPKPASSPLEAPRPTRNPQAKVIFVMKYKQSKRDRHRSTNIQYLNICLCASGASEKFRCGHQTLIKSLLKIGATTQTCSVPFFDSHLVLLHNGFFAMPAYRNGFSY